MKHRKRHPKLRVGIATSGRFHLLDLARELDALGLEVRFYSYVPRRRAARFGLPSSCHVSLLPFLAPLVTWERFWPRVFPGILERLMYWALNLLVIVRMQPCEIFICMSGVYLHAPRFAKWRYGAKVILHRGSQHVLAVDQILSKGSQVRPSKATIRRELLGYELADLIEIASSHVEESFAPWPHLTSKLVRNMYGTDIKQFPLQLGAAPDEPTVLFVGHWSYQKGADVLAGAIRSLRSVRLVHVGAVVDVAFPNEPRFLHYEPVAQWTLKEYYKAAHVFVLASREDGFGVVLSQALASGLWVVCTQRTGGPDLIRAFGLARLIRVVPAEDVNALAHAIEQAIDDATGKTGIDRITDEERTKLNWKGYGLRELEIVTSLLQADPAVEH